MMELYDISAGIIHSYLDENDLGNYEQKDFEEMYIKFQREFSPTILENYGDFDVLNMIFQHDGDESNLCFNLEYSKDYVTRAGDIRGGTAYKYSLFKNKRTGKWIAGGTRNTHEVDLDEAVEIAVNIRDAIVKGAKFIKNSKLDNVEDYKDLEKELQDIFSECTVNSYNVWIHKYYGLIFPDKFPIVHKDEKKIEFLKKFNIPPEKGYYVLDGQLYLLSKKAGIKFYSLFEDNIVNLFSKNSIEVDNENLNRNITTIKSDNIIKKFAVNNKLRNIIYFGAPGTGKSYILNQDKEILLNNYKDNYERVTFHPDYSYANFVGTYKPVPKNNYITYKYVPGPFMRVLKKSLDKPSEDFLLVIEEINRANVAAVFGDVFQLLDRNENNESMYPIDATEDMKTYINQDKIIIPSNMFIWATMNSADQGVFPMDTAFKRRWDFKYFSINNNEFLIENTKTFLNDLEVNWNSLRKAINDELLEYKINEDKLMGPFFAFNEFMNQEIPETIFKEIFKSKIIMYLFEDAAKSKRNNLFEGVGKGKNFTYSQVCEEFDKNGIGIFNNSIKKKFITYDGE